MAQQTPPAVRVARRQPRLVGWLACLIALLMAIAMAEGILRWTGLYTPPPSELLCDRPTLYASNPDYGYALIPGLETTYTYPAGSTRALRLKANAHGFRLDRELHERDHRRRVLVLGDSLTFGEGVDQDERFTERLEAAHPEWRLDNIGMTGYGTDLMLRAAAAMVPIARPAVVLTCIYTDDLRRVAPYYAGVGFPIPRYFLADNGLTSGDYPAVPIWRRLHLVEAASRASWRYGDQERKLNTAILDSLADLVRHYQGTLAIAFLPGRADTPNDRQRRLWIADQCARLECPFVDLTHAIVVARNAEYLFIAENWHLNAKGHQVVADELAPILQGLLSDTSQ